MRKPQQLKTKSGEIYWRVRYRRDDAQGISRQRAMSFHGPNGKAEADEFSGLLNTLGADRAVEWWNSHLDPETNQHGLTLDTWWPRYLGSLTGITEGTRVTYQRTYDRVWSKPLGSKPLAAITREDVARVVNELSAEKSDKTVRNAYGVLSSCFKVAAADGLIPAVPTRGIRLPRRTEHTATEMRFLDHDDWSRLLVELPAHYRPLFTFLVGTGARWGEAEALEVRDVDLERMIQLSDDSYVAQPVVTISKAAKWNASKATREVGPTKTRRSRRTITLPPEVVDAVTPLLGGRRPSERLFLAPRGGPLRHRTVYDEWKAAVERAGLDPHPRIHDLRHTHVAWLIAASIPLPVIQARLGHEHISTTIDRYGHLLPDLQVAAAQAASVAMQPRRALPPPATSAGAGSEHRRPAAPG